MWMMNFLESRTFVLERLMQAYFEIFESVNIRFYVDSEKLLLKILVAVTIFASIIQYSMHPVYISE